MCRGRCMAGWLARLALIKRESGSALFVPKPFCKLACSSSCSQKYGSIRQCARPLTLKPQNDAVFDAPSASPSRQSPAAPRTRRRPPVQRGATRDCAGGWRRCVATLLWMKCFLQRRLLRPPASCSRNNVLLPGNLKSNPKRISIGDRSIE